MRDPSFQKMAGKILGITAVVLILDIVLLPRWVEQLLHSRLFMGLIAAWCVVSALLLHQRIRAGLVQGAREFKKASHCILNDDDDDYPKAA